ncbi:MAG: hypothetical protein AAF402_15935 [Pseudomonadota bacterium]
MAPESAAQLATLIWQLKKQLDRLNNENVDLKRMLADPAFRRITAEEATESGNRQLQLAALRVLKADNGLPIAPRDEVVRKTEASEKAQTIHSEMTDLYSISPDERSLLQDSEFASLVADTNSYLRKKQVDNRAPLGGAQRKPAGSGVSSWVALATVLVVCGLVVIGFWQQ